MQTITPCLDVDASSGGGLPVVLLHGWTGSKEDFAAVVEPLAAQRRVIVPDLPGHGDSQPPVDGDYSFAAHVAWILKLLDGLGVVDLHLVGHSHGGLVAQRVAYAAAHRIASLTLVGTGLGALGDVTGDMIIRVVTTAMDHGMEAAWEVVSGTAEPGAAPDPREAFVRERFLSMTPEAVRGVGRNLVTASPLGAFLYGIDFPVLVCHGEGDTAWLPHEQRLLASRIAGARYAVVPDALHSPAVENPVGFLDLLLPFLDAA